MAAVHLPIQGPDHPGPQPGGPRAPPDPARAQPSGLRCRRRPRLLGGAPFSFSHVGYLVSDKRIVVILDSTCRPCRQSGSDAVTQHLTNLVTPATPLYFNTLYDPYRPGADFVRGYPFSLRSGAHCAVSCGLFSEGAFVDAVVTVPSGAMMVIPAVNVACDRAAMGPALLPRFHVAAPAAEIWAGLCGKLVADHLGLGVKSGLPYVGRCWLPDGLGAVLAPAEVAAERAALEFFGKARLPRTTVVAAQCVRQLAEMVRKQLGTVHPGYVLLADAMLAWLDLWDAFESSRR